MLEAISYSSKIKINDIPPQWLSKIELYYPELPNFPVLYIHKYVKAHRIYGFPVAISSTEMNDEGLLNITFEVLSNFDLNEDDEIKNSFADDLKERIGASDKISKNDIDVMCKGDQDYIKFFKKLWEPIEEVYGKYIPYGKFCEELYSIVRFVAAFQPKTGKQSEMRMLYNFMSIFGERIEVSVEGKWEFCDFYLIPSYTDLLNKNFSDFPKFQKLFYAMEKVHNLSFISVIKIGKSTPISIKCQKKAFAQNKETFTKENLENWVENGSITEDDKFYIERLVDAFNRLPRRAAFFISSIFITFQKPYETWNKEFFIEFYTSDKKGISPKVVACFIQQGFKNTAVIPIDTWVKSFYEGALNINDNITFFNAFNDIGKLERIIWLSSQANKTNIRQFFNTLWCCRYGTKGNKQLRKQNPLACYECNLREVCKGYKNIENRKIYIAEGVVNLSNLFNTLSDDVLFICEKDNNIPKKIYRRSKKEYYLTDEFSGYLLEDNKTLLHNKVVLVDELLQSISPAYDTSKFNSFEFSEL
ncbi:MAG: hypothetical protein IJ099_05180 [Alphaproteobacteria bacterium]|nr:hypothetical protein [Alphaproteobacteria bacterium]